MQLINTTIVTSLDEIQELMRHIVVNEMTGQINLTFEGEHIRVWQPSKEVMAESVTSIPIVTGIRVVHGREFCSDVYNEPQPTDQC